MDTYALHLAMAALAGASVAAVSAYCAHRKTLAQLLDFALAAEIGRNRPRNHRRRPRQHRRKRSALDLRSDLAAADVGYAEMGAVRAVDNGRELHGGRGMQTLPEETHRPEPEDAFKDEDDIPKPVEHEMETEVGDWTVVK